MAYAPEIASHAIAKAEVMDIRVYMAANVCVVHHQDKIYRATILHEPNTTPVCTVQNQIVIDENQRFVACSLVQSQICIHLKNSKNEIELTGLYDVDFA